MDIEFDTAKDLTNIASRGLSLALATDLEWDTVVCRQDTRKAYPEARFIATGYIGDRLFRVVFCNRPNATRIISLRKANNREIDDYARS